MMTRLFVLLLPASLLAQSKVDFAKEIQPIFAKSCNGCHGAAAMGGLRLDSKTLAAKSIKAGNAAGSSLYARVAGLGDQARMPMGAKPLPPEQIDAIKRWIDEGATWPDTLSSANAEIKKHWAFLPPKKTAPPKALKNPIDSFVLPRLEKEGLAFSPEADKTTLLRRLHLDLTGLPPSIDEVDAFLKDKSLGAYDRQVERLLASQHYGERWARHWLDAARYADSDGFEKDKQRNVWFFRDWVIKAFNRDLPYNQFLTEQLAGDLLPNATQDQKVATGFLRNSMINEEGGIEPEQFRMEAMFDRMDAIGKGMLGLTIGCAQCHNHKYDPLTQEEYYKLFAFLNNSSEGSAAVYTAEEQMKRANIFAKVKEIEQGLQHRHPDWKQRMSSWEASVKNEPTWTVLKPAVDDISTGGQKYIPQPDGSFLAYGYAPTKHRVKMTQKITEKNIRAIRLELLMDPNLPLGGPGRSIKGTGALTQFDVEIAPANQPDAKPTKVKVASATADLNLPEAPLDSIYDDKSKKRRVTGPIAFAIDDDDNTAWGIDAGPHLRNQPRKAVFTFAEPVGFDGGTILTIYLKQNAGGWNSDDNQNHNLGRIRLSMTTAESAKADPLPAAVRDLIAKPTRTAAEDDIVFSYYRTIVPEWTEANREIAELWRQHPEGTSQLILQERMDERRMTFQLQRGDFLKPGKQVEPGVPAFLNAMPAGAKPDRLGLARWMTDKQAPTTARALVNRVWQTYFGTGITSTPEDFGKQTDPPSHPELLDWLAADFMEKGWSLKNLHRLIVTSQTYKQSSKLTPTLSEKDPFNRLLSRGPRFRVEGEIVRDIALAASGLLNPRVGGPSVYPPSPEFLYLPPTSYGPKNWKEETGPERYRRGMYTFAYRSVPYPALQNFDTPNGDTACVRRSRSNTPLQALTTLNEPLFLEAARALAQKTIHEGGKSDAERIEYAFRRVLSRKPTAEEAATLADLFTKQYKRYEGAGAHLGEVQAYTAVARVLLNLDETITKE